ncbi:MAG: ATP-binding protein [Methylococcales bacterium]|nr:ATP-binding protein [Methylococcales bacterium]
MNTLPMLFANILPRTAISTQDNLKWLFILRNLMIVSETVLIILSVYGLSVPLPQQHLWLVIMAIGSVNLYTWMRLKTDNPVTELELFSQLVIDVLAIASLLYLTGGASNPIIWVFLLPLILTSIMLPSAYAWYMVILTCSVYTILIPYNVSLPAIEPHMPSGAPELERLQQLMGEMGEHASDMKRYEVFRKMHELSDRHYYNLHIFGMWFGFVFSAGLVAFFVIELSRTLRAQERHLAEAREKALQDERVVSLGTLAASAAHDMSTPLATIDIIAHELEQDYPAHRLPDLYDKTLIIQDQVKRCKQALSLMSASAGEMRAEAGKVMKVHRYLNEVIKQWRSHKPETKLDICLQPVLGQPVCILAEQTLTHALINILNNAAELTDKSRGIVFSTQLTERAVLLEVRDYGPGFPDAVRYMNGRQPVKSDKKGLGVGLFLACSTIRRLGGEIQFINYPEGGACVRVELLLLTASLEDKESYGTIFG